MIFSILFTDKRIFYQGDFIFYLNSFVLFSFLGFFLESFVYKCAKSDKHSGALYGPYTLVYGTGFTLILLFFKNTNFCLNFWSLILYYLSFCVIATSCEYLFGNIIKFIFHVDMWDYSSYKYHFGKYICLRYFFCWGLIASIIIFGCYNFLNSILSLISYEFSLIILFIMFLDFLFSYLKMIKKQFLVYNIFTNKKK